METDVLDKQNLKDAVIEEYQEEERLEQIIPLNDILQMLMEKIRRMEEKWRMEDKWRMEERKINENSKEINENIKEKQRIIE